MSFAVGEKIVCIDDDWHGDERAVPLLGFILHVPTKRHIYTVRSVNGPNELGHHYIRVAEITNPEPPKHGEVEWRSDMFRPVIERSTSIEIFERMLNPGPATKPVAPVEHEQV